MNKKTLSELLEQTDDGYIEEFYGIKDELAAKKARKKRRNRLITRAAVLICTVTICAALAHSSRAKENFFESPTEDMGYHSSSGKDSDTSYAVSVTPAESTGETAGDVGFTEDTRGEAPPTLEGDFVVEGSEFPPLEGSDEAEGNHSVDDTTPPTSPEIMDMMASDSKVSVLVKGTATRYNGNLGATDNSPPAFGFAYDCVTVTAQAMEELPAVYETLSDYGSVYTQKYRVFKMRVKESLGSGLTGVFYYALPHNLQGDLTQYDTLLLAMTFKGRDYFLKNTEENRLVCFDKIFADYRNSPEFGNIIAFNNGMFDESLWQDKSWSYGYQFACDILESGELDEQIIVKRGATLEDSLAVLEKLKADNFILQAPMIDYTYRHTEAVSEAEGFVKPFENGIFVPTVDGNDVVYRRYIGGCPTNEWIRIEQNGNVIRSKDAFEDGDFEKLPDISKFVSEMKLDSYRPQHMNTEGKKLMLNSVMGWYEKNTSGVYSVIKISWVYCELDYSMEYRDESFILLTENGAKNVSREEITALIGENDNIFYGEYGVGMEIPME